MALQLSTIREKLHPRTLLQILGAVGIVLLVVVVLSPRSQDIVAPRFDSSEKLGADISITINPDIAFEKQNLAIHNVQRVLPPKDLAAHFAQILKLEKHPLSENIYQSEDASTTISQDPTGQRINYTYIDFSQPEGQKPARVGKESALDFAQGFLNSLQYPTQQMSLVEKETRFLNSSNPEDIQDVSEGEATIVVLQYVRLLDELPVTFSNNPLNTVELWVTAKGVEKATLPSLFFESQKGESQAMLSKDELLANIKSGHFSVITSTQAVALDPAELEVTAFEISSAHLEYRIDESQGLILPYVRFLGTATLKNRQTSPLSIITPAIKTLQR